MKLIIDIPEEEYFVIKHYGDIPLNKTYFTAMSIINGIPLDKIRAEIQENINYNKKMNYQGIVAGLLLTLNIIDKYKAESEDKE